MGIISDMANFAMQEQMFQYHKGQDAKKWELVDETQARQDNAVQRKAADMEAAGMSKTLAAGGSAESAVSSPSSQAQAPQIGGEGIMGAVQGVANLIQQDSQISQTKAQTKLTNQALENAKADEKNKYAQLTGQQINNIYALKHDQPLGDTPEWKKEINELIAQGFTYLKNKAMGGKSGG